MILHFSTITLDYSTQHTCNSVRANKTLTQPLEVIEKKVWGLGIRPNFTRPGLVSNPSLGLNGVNQVTSCSQMTLFK